MKLYKDGITRNTENPNVISDLKKAGYVEVAKPLKENPTEKKAAESAKEGE
jgi:hypothetical protein